MRKMMLAMAALAVIAPAWSWAGEADDRQVADRIASNLKHSGRLQDYKIGVAYRDGTAWLSGNVTDADQLVAALEIAQATEGVHQVVNRLATAPAQKQGVGQRLKTGLQSLAGQGAASPAGSDIQLTSTSVQDQVRQQVANQSTWPTRAGSFGAPAPPSPRGTQAAALPNHRPSTLPVRNGGYARSAGAPRPYARTASTGAAMQPPAPVAAPNAPAYVPGVGRVAAAQYDNPTLPPYAWPSYAAHPNYAGVTYPKQYSPTAWPYIGPFYPYPQVPLGWRQVNLQWDDGWWFLDFHERNAWRPSR